MPSGRHNLLLFLAFSRKVSLLSERVLSISLSIVLWYFCHMQHPSAWISCSGLAIQSGSKAKARNPSGYSRVEFRPQSWFGRKRKGAGPGSPGDPAGKERRRRPHRSQYRPVYKCQAFRTLQIMKSLLYAANGGGQRARI